MLSTISSKKFEMVKNQISYQANEIHNGIEIVGNPETKTERYWEENIATPAYDQYHNWYFSIRDFAIEEETGIYEVDEYYQGLFRSNHYFDFISLRGVKENWLGVASDTEQIKNYASDLNKLKDKNYAILKVSLDDRDKEAFSDKNKLKSSINIITNEEVNIVFKICVFE